VNIPSTINYQNRLVQFFKATTFSVLTTVMPVLPKIWLQCHRRWK